MNKFMRTGHLNSQSFPLRRGFFTSYGYEVRLSSHVNAEQEQRDIERHRANTGAAAVSAAIAEIMPDHQDESGVDRRRVVQHRPGQRVELHILGYFRVFPRYIFRRVVLSLRPEEAAALANDLLRGFTITREPTKNAVPRGARW